MTLKSVLSIQIRADFHGQGLGLMKMESEMVSGNKERYFDVFDVFDVYDVVDVVDDAVGVVDDVINMISQVNTSENASKPVKKAN